MFKFCVASSLLFTAWHYRQHLRDSTKTLLVSQTKRILRQELRQEKFIDYTAGNLGSVVQRFVLESPQVNHRTAELLHQLFQVERIKKVCLNLFVMALAQAEVQMSLKHSAVSTAKRHIDDK